MRPIEFIRKHWIGLGIGSIGWAVALPYFIHYHVEYGGDFWTHLLNLEHLLLLTWIPGFMLAGYLYDRKLMSERRLASSEERHRVLVEDALDGINIVDREGNFVLVNPEYCRMLGYSAGELVGESFLITLPAGNREEGMRLFRKAIREPVKPYTYEGKNLRKDGSIIDVQIKWNYVYREGKVAGTMAIVRDITERKEMAEGLKHAEREWSNTFNSISDFVSVHDRDFRFVKVNTALADFLGVSPKELIGKYCYEAFHSTREPWPNCPHVKTLELKKPVTEEVDDPNIGCPLEVTTSPIFDNNGELLGSVHIAKNITERKKAEEALKDSEEKYRLLVENTETGFVVVDETGVVVEANEPYLRMVGVEHLSDIIGRSVLDWTAPECVEDNAAAVARCAEQGFVQDFETTYLRDDGTRINILINATMQETPDGKRLNALCRDITERKQAEETRAFLANITKHATDAIVGLDLDTNVVSWNRGAEMLFGYSAQEIIGKPWSLVVPKEAREACRKRFKKATFEGFVKTAETMRVAKGNKEFPAEMTLTTLKDEAGEHIGFVTITRDITERKEAEEEIRRYTQELERSNRLKDLFTDIMRHDILNPVAVIKGVSQILRQESSGKTLEGLEKIGKGAFKIEEMVESAARLSKLDAEEELRFEKLDLNIIFREVVENFSPMLMEKGMRVEYLPRGKRVAMVSAIIEDVFANMLSNAVKYSPPESTVTIGILDEGEAWKVMVADQGEGVPDEYKKAIFDRFERGGKKGVRGTGLGLAIVKRIVKLHRGRVWVEDNTPRGSIFYVVIPKNGKEVRD